MVINREETIRRKGYDPANLSKGSGKKVWDNCNKCGKGRWVEKRDANRLCIQCASKSEETRLKISKTKTGTTLSDEHKAKISKSLEGNQRTKGFHHSDKTCKQMSESHTGMVFSDEHIVNMKNSESAKASQDKQRGGNDMVKHHYIYDHSDLSKYTMKVTRSKHAKIHAWMRKAGIVVPHINENI